MTDNEIIKALGACLHRGCNVCIRRPEEYGVTERQCSRGLMKDALSLINRQKTELDDLKRDDLPRCKDALRRANEIGMAVDKENQELRAEIERLQKVNDSFTDIGKLYSEIKSEAYKEFAERLEPKLANNTDISAVGYQSVIAEIDNLVKEMVGDSNV